MSDIGTWISDFYKLNPDALADTADVPVAKTWKLDLNKVLMAIDTRDRGFYSRLTADEKKEANPWKLMRFMSSSVQSPERYLTRTNKIINCRFGAIPKEHIELQWLLLTACSSGKSVKHVWIPPSRKALKNRLEEALIQLNPRMKDDELALWQKINTKADFIQYFKDNAFDDNTIKEIFKGSSKE